MRNLDLEAFNRAECNSVLATGIVTEPELHFGAIRWVAIKGHGNDWAIYYHVERYDISVVRMSGEKISSANLIENLVPCTKEVLSLYRL